MCPAHARRDRFSRVGKDALHHAREDRFMTPPIVLLAIPSASVLLVITAVGFAATAVFRLGECYRKLGKTNEAVLQYDRIVREFADEATLATLSRQNLAGLGSAPAVPAAPVLSDAVRQEQKRMLEEECVNVLEFLLALRDLLFDGPGHGPPGRRPCPPAFPAKMSRGT